MAWRLSTAMVKALLGGTPTVDDFVNETTITMGDGDGAGGNDTIDLTAGLDAFLKHQWILIVGGVNHNIMCKVVIAGSGTIEVPAGSLVGAQTTGTAICILNLGDGGSVQKILQNGTIDIYSGTRPADADTTESPSGQVFLLPLTLDGGAFVPGQATNGINLGQFSGSVLKRAIDPETGSTEIWRGAGVADNTAGWARWYANDKITGVDADAIRMDGVVATTGADLNMVNGTSIATGIYSEVSDVAMAMTSV